MSDCKLCNSEMKVINTSDDKYYANVCNSCDVREHYSPSGLDAIKLPINKTYMAYIYFQLDETCLNYEDKEDSFVSFIDIAIDRST